MAKKTRWISDENRKKTEWTIDEIAELYITRNYCMDLVSEVTGIAVAPLSRMLWDAHLPDRKRDAHGGQFPVEVWKLSPEDAAEFFESAPDMFRAMDRMSQKDMEDEFLKEVAPDKGPDDEGGS